MNSSSVLFAIRVYQQIKALVETMARSDGFTEAFFVERLVWEEARRRNIVAPDDPGMALMDLQIEAAKYLKCVRASADEHVTRGLFDHIQRCPRLFELHELAVRSPSPKIRPEKRRQYVHQRLGRFAKAYLGRKSLGEALLPPGSGALIRGYTRLGK